MKALDLFDQNQIAVHPALCTGIALAATVALLYALCTFVWLFAPGPSLGFLNSLFWGLDFNPLQISEAFSWGGFVQALLGLALWAFLAGTFFGWLRLRLSA